VNGKHIDLMSKRLIGRAETPSIKMDVGGSCMQKMWPYNH